ncbi:MAG: CvpA family protein [Thermodesulfobacteriota bacterium]|nr:CvpA family protein [Thermodesulfobacteriota bacterium]
MNLLDIILIATMVFLVVRGILRGFLLEIGSLAGVILGICFANIYQPQMTEHLKTHLPSVRFYILQLISFSMIFATVLVSCNLAGWGLKMIFKKAFLGWLDRTLGAGLAIFKGVIITYLFIVLLTFFVPSKTPLVARSKLAPLIIGSYQSMISLISPGSYQRWKKKFLGQKEKVGAMVSEKIEDLTGKDGFR